MKCTSLAIQVVLGGFLGAASAAAGAEKPDTPRVDCVIPLIEQPHAVSPHTIWYDDFDADRRSYAEGSTTLDDRVSLGMRGRSMPCLYEKGGQGSGGRKVFFGDSPVYRQHCVRRGEVFEEVYWRMYVKHPYGWMGSPAKMSRATSLTSAKWTQAMIAHVWSGSDSSLTLDPVRGVEGDRVVTRQYNDFAHLKWLGNKPVSKFPIHATEESGCWVLVEARAKLNTPGKKDGLNQLWIDGRLECERRNLDFRGAYTNHGINAVFLEAYWNEGSPVRQTRWIDHFVISTKPIGPVVCPANPTIVKTPYHGPGRAGGWEVQLATDYDGNGVVYESRSGLPGDRMIVDIEHGRFVGALAGKAALEPDTIYFARVRQSSNDGSRSDWSRWHQGFRVE